MLKLVNLEKEKFDNFVFEHKQKSHFLQSQAWGEFSKIKKNLTPHYLGLIDQENEIIAATLLLLLGTILGTKIYSAKESLENVFAAGQIYYFLQEGIYTSKEIMEENTKNITSKIINKENNKYYVYLGITKDETNAKKIKNIYIDKGYNIYIKEVKLNNEEFYNNVTQFDLLINNTSNKNEILTITEVVLANYEEIVKTQ